MAENNDGNVEFFNKKEEIFSPYHFKSKKTIKNSCNWLDFFLFYLCACLYDSTLPVGNTCMSRIQE